MYNRIPSVRDTYFQHKTLTTVTGKPSYDCFQKVYTELKVNASAVPTTLGGGLHGHLGLLLSDVRYQTLSTTAFVAPPNPGLFAPPVTGTAAQLEATKDVWKDSKMIFEISQATSKALIAQLIESIDSIYIRALLNRNTGQYSDNVIAIITHLFSTYGHITPQQVKAREINVYNMHHDISMLVDVVFNAIDDLADFADHAVSPMSAQQQIDLAYVIFAKQPILQQDLCLWNRLPTHDWTVMQRHFRDAQVDLSSLLTASDMFSPDAAHHQANVTTMSDLVAQRLLDAMPPPYLTDTTVASTLATDPTPTAMINVAQPPSRDTALLEQMQAMMTMMMASSGPRSQYGGRGRGRGRHTSRTPGRGSAQAPR